jgi:hypothetical protein
MPSWNDFISHMALKEWIAVTIIAAVAIFCREGSRLKKLFGGKR